ncbi:hypothetical protein niasHS_008975 [Heterodera schachtii]|uniref:FLYWCH-type domain-containing protein n=1 Tax=Heterodera schachtii TaxID=97005 RepID=A0ABD2J1U1_HETSC
MIRLLDDSSTQPKCDDSSTQPKSHDSSITRFVYSMIRLLSQKQMKSIRNIIEQQQRRKASKRTRKSSEFDDSSVFQTQSEGNDDEEPASDEGFRFTRRKGRWFRCSNRDCDATAVVNEDGEEGAITGMIGKKGHNHLPNPACFHAEQKRNKIKTTTMENPRQKPSKVLAEVRANTKDETFVSMGTDFALAAVMRRQKRKIYGNIDRVNPLNVVLPDALLMKDGENTLLYDSRVHRKGQSDVVLLLDVLKRARKISVDGTFKVSPAAWTQCFVIGAFVNRRLALCVHALLPGKQRKYYEEALNAVKAVIAPNTPAHSSNDSGHARDVSSGPSLAAFFGYFARVYVGLTAHEQEAGAVAFAPSTDPSRRSSISTNATGDDEYSRRNSFVNLDHVYGNNFIQFGNPSPVPSTPTTQSSTTFLVVPRWELPIVRPPLYPVHFWNVHDRARSAVEKTNNAMEASHLQFSRGLVHHPSLSDFLAAILDDVDKQVDIARSARVFPHKRRIKYILKEQLIGDALDEAEYNTDEDVMNILSLLSLQMQGYVGGLRARGAQREHEDRE